MPYVSNTVKVLATTLAVVVVSICTAVLSVLPAGNAKAANSVTEVTFCGAPISNVNPAAGIPAVEQQLGQGNDQLVSAIARAIGLGRSPCQLINFLIETGAEVVVDGALLEVVDVRLPNGIDELVAATHTAIQNAEAETRLHFLTFGPSGALVWAPVSWATLGVKCTVRTRHEPSPRWGRTRWYLRGHSMYVDRPDHCQCWGSHQCLGSNYLRRCDRLCG